MLKKFKEELQKKIKENEKMHDEFRNNPSATKSKECARRSGITILVVGFIPALVFYWEWTYADSFFIFFPIAAVVLWGFGLWILLTGKLPKA